MFGFKPDLYVKFLLTVIAVSLAILAGQSLMSSTIPTAQAQTASEEEVEMVLDAKVIRKFDAPDVSEVIILGDHPLLHEELSYEKYAERLAEASVIE